MQSASACATSPDMCRYQKLPAWLTPCSARNAIRLTAGPGTHAADAPPGGAGLAARRARSQRAATTRRSTRSAALIAPASSHQPPFETTDRVQGTECSARRSKLNHGCEKQTLRRSVLVVPRCAATQAGHARGPPHSCFTGCVVPVALAPASRRRSPTAPVRSCRSLPARSTMCRRATDAAPASPASVSDSTCAPAELSELRAC